MTLIDLFDILIEADEMKCTINPFSHEANMQQTTLNIFCQKMRLIIESTRTNLENDDLTTQSPTILKNPKQCRLL